MIDISSTYKALVNQLLSATLTDIAESDIAWNNSSFDPTGKQAWLDTWYTPVEINSTSKDTAGAQQTGYFQVTVYVPLVSVDGSVNYDLKQMQIMNEVLSAFSTNTVASYDNVNVEILNSTIQSARKSGGWYARDITINFLKIGE